MSEPLSDETLARYAELLAELDDYTYSRYPDDLGDAIRALLAEVARLKAENNQLRRDAVPAALADAPEPGRGEE